MYNSYNYNMYEIYELKKNKKYLVVDFHKKFNLNENGIPDNAVLYNVSGPEQVDLLIRDLNEKAPMQSIEKQDIFPVTMKTLKDLFAADLDVDQDREYLCDSCTEIENCPLFSKGYRYNSLYCRDRIYKHYSYLKYKAVKATILKCYKYKPGLINRDRGFIITVKKCSDCPHYEEEEHFDDSSSYYCNKACKQIQEKYDGMGGDVEYIPDWCPELPKENLKGD